MADAKPDPNTSAVGRAILNASTGRSETPAPASAADTTWSPARICNELRTEADRLDAIALQMSFYDDDTAPWARARHDLAEGAKWCRVRARIIQESTP